MRQFIADHFEHFLCGLLLISRLGDIGSTYLVTPKLTLEANPIMRRLGWRFALLSILVCLVPYFSTQSGVMILVPFLLVSSSNTAKIWFIRSYGELAYRELLVSLARKSKLRYALAGVNGSAAFLLLLGLVMLYLSPDPARYWGFWIALGIILYAITVALWGSVYFWRLFKLAKRKSFDAEK